MGKVTHSRRVGLALSALLVIFTFTCWCCGTNESSGCKRPIEPSQGLCEGEMGRCSASRRKVTFDYSQNLVFEQTWCSAYWIVCFQNSETRNYVQLLPSTSLSDFWQQCVGRWVSFGPVNMLWHVYMCRHTIVICWVCETLYGLLSNDGTCKTIFLSLITHPPLSFHPEKLYEPWV